MTNHSFAVVFALMLAAANAAQAQWTLQSPIPTGRHLYSVDFITPAHGFVVGINRQLLETTDGGATWVTRMSDALGTDPFNEVSFSDNLHGYVVGNSSDAWRTADGGQTWAQMTTVPSGSWRDIDFITPTRGFIGANGVLAFTTDGGISWITRSAYPNCPVIFGMDFRDEQTGIVGGLGLGTNPDGIFKTTDGGTTWSNKSTRVANDVLWWNTNVALAATDGGSSIYRSTDAGESWNLFASGITTGMFKLERINNTTLAGVSGKGDVWRSTNEGSTWSQVFDGPGDLPATWSIRFVDSLHGWVVGQSGFIFASDDGGITWRQVSNGVGVQVYDIEMHTDNFGMAVGHNGYLFKTTNGGSWWDVRKLEVTGQIFGRDEGLQAISIVDTSFAVAAGPGGTVFKTADGGGAWQSVGYPNLPDHFWIEDVEFVSRNEGWLVGLDQDLVGHDKTVYHTTDAGVTWMQGMSQNSYMYSVDFVDSLYGWISTIGELYFRTTNRGTTWLQGVLPSSLGPPRGPKVKFANRQVGWAVAWDGYVARSVDGGVSWALQNIGTTEDHIFAIEVISPSEVWLTGREEDISSRDGVIYRSTNGGTTWSREIVAPDPYWGVAITVSPSGSIWFAGYEGRIVKKDATTGIPEDRKKTIPQAFRLYQNYPNPFNPSTTIRFEIPRSGLVSLKVFDVLGREVATLMNEEKSPGNYSVRWDATNVGSGTYFARLESNGKRQMTKMLLMR